MPTPLAPALEDLRSLILDPQRCVRVVGGGRRRGAALPQPKRVVLRPVDLKAGRRLLVESWDGQQTSTAHFGYDSDAAARVDELLGQPYGNWHVELVDGTVQLRVTKRGEAQVHRSDASRSQDTSHDRQSQRVLPDTDPVLRAVGADKRRQVEAFLRALDPVLPEIDGRPLGLVDLGCGNAALTLAAYRHVTAGLGRAARVVGVDRKEQARAHNEAVVTELGWSDSVSFVVSPIDSAEVDLAPAQLDVVLALHACDTATDDALARAVRWQAPVILAAPCCHHDVQRQLSEAEGPAPYPMLTRYGILRERFADVLTDSLRAELLRLLGYRVDVVEFVGSRHTPRNTLIRAVHTGAAPDPGRVAEYVATKKTWHVRPRLESLLEDRLGSVLDP